MTRPSARSRPTALSTVLRDMPVISTISVRVDFFARSDELEELLPGALTG